MLGDGHVDHRVRFDHFRIERPGLQGDPLDLHVLELPVVHMAHVSAAVPCRFGDPALDIAAPRVVHGAVEDLHLLRAGLDAEPHHLGHHLGIGVPCLLRNAVPGDVRLHHHDVAAGHELLHPAQGLDCRPSDGRC